ncbi:MAG: ribonuclease R [Pigmentiphaga sp.]|nr:ribonuclease R [Pigmentiphaga sp.]
MPNDFDPDVPTREEILRVLREAPEPLSQEALAERLGVVRAATWVGFERRLAAMERDGQLLPNRKGVLLLADKLDFIAGRVQGHRDGFGFLVRDDGGQDLFLSPREMLKVMHGDRVLARQSGEFRGKPDGQIVEIIEHSSRRLVGRLERERGITIIVPEDPRVRHDILVAPGDEAGARPGQVVTVELITPPTRHSPPQGKVVEVLGEAGDPGMEIEIAVRKFDVPHEFSTAAKAFAAKLPDAVRRVDLAGRVDLRDVPLMTIDGADARDFDDAVYCEPVELGNGARKRPGWRLLVAIADVSHYVKPGEPLDDDALERATSVYFPRRVIPMLPESLSNGLCSLNPGVDRLVLVCDMVVPANGAKAGQVTGYQFYNAVMHSQARTTYDQVWHALSGEMPEAPPLPPLMLPHVQHLHQLFECLAEARRRRGAIDFDTVETRIESDADGRIQRIVPAYRNDAHRLIEECMLAANTCAADFLLRSKHPGLFRVHDSPSEERLEKLREYLRQIGLTLGGGDKPDAIDYGKLLQQARERPDFGLIQTMCLRSMQQAVYSPGNLGHFGLAYPAYAHFTSPIRRYPDLLTHRAIKALVEGKRYVPSIAGEKPVASRGSPEQENATWEQLGLLCSARERRADEASRDVEAWLKCWYMRERVGEIFAGTVSGVASFGLFVTLDALFVEGLVHISELGSEYFHYVQERHELRGERTGKRYGLTMPVRVQVARVDLDTRRIEFRLESELASTGAERRRPTDDAGGEPPVLMSLPPPPARLGGAISGTGKTAKAGKSSRPGKSEQKPSAAAVTVAKTGSSGKTAKQTKAAKAAKAAKDAGGAGNRSSRASRTARRGH